MRMRSIGSGLAVGACMLAVGIAQAAAEDNPYLGEWAVTIQDPGSTFNACWLDVEGKGGGLDMRALWRAGGVFKPKSVRLVDGELQWVRDEWWGEKEKAFPTTYHAKIENGKLVGWAKMPWGATVRFVGIPSVDQVGVAGKWICVAAEDPDQLERTVMLEQDGDKVTGKYSDIDLVAPIKAGALNGNKLKFEIAGDDFQVKCEGIFEGDRVRGTYDTGGDWGSFKGKRQRKVGEKLVLFDGTSLKGWHSRNPKVNKPRWGLSEGYTYPLKGGSDLVSDQKFEDFRVLVEYRFPEDEPNGNSGIYVRGRYEVQLADDYGKGPSKGGCGALYSRVVPTKNVTKPKGTWQTMDITIVGHYITVKHNGEVIVDNAYLEGITGGALDADDNAPGPILLQAHGQKVNFRKVEVWPLLK